MQQGLNGRFSSRTAPRGAAGAFAVLALAMFIGAIAEKNWWGMAAFVVAIVLLAVWLGRRRAMRRRRLIEAADTEHAALMRGDEQTGTYGHFQPYVPIDPDSDERGAAGSG